MQFRIDADHTFYFFSINGLQFLDEVLHWPGGTTTAPLGRPNCGWDREFCRETNTCKHIFSNI